MIADQHSVVLSPTRAAFNSAQTVQTLGHVHFIGIGGAGMSVLAEMLHQSGVKVSGCDAQENAKTLRLCQLGIPVAIGQSASHVDNVDYVAYSSAIKPNNPELLAAHNRGVSLVHRSDILALLLHEKRSITVAGAHGKTTTSSMIAHILTRAGSGIFADPSYAIGGSIQNPADPEHTIDGGHAGGGAFMVAEADESDGSFLKYHPYIAIVTNAEPDHLDHYHDASNYHQAFIEYMSHSTHAVVTCIDDRDVRNVLDMCNDAILNKTVVYGTRESFNKLTQRVKAAVRYVSVALSSCEAQGGSESVQLVVPSLITHQAEQHITLQLAVPGMHNALNAAAALIAVQLLGMDIFEAADSLITFRGAARRFDIRGVQRNVTVIDDYAHHPTEIAALLQATRRRYPHAKVRVLFQPHLFSRTQNFAIEFAQALSLADDVVITPIYPARERQEDFPQVSAQTIVDASKNSALHTPMQVAQSMNEGASSLVERAQSGDILLTVGAGSITAMTSVMLELLAS